MNPSIPAMSEEIFEKFWIIIDEYIANYNKGVEKYGSYWKVGTFYRGSTKINRGKVASAQVAEP
jgi:hypothetical protein